MSARADAIKRICDALMSAGAAEAAEVTQRDYPFVPTQRYVRKHNDAAALRVFLRDGFIDRYSGDQLVFPAVLRVLTAQIPDAFPFHPNWKTDRTHPAYWELFPTLDHVVPIAMGGRDEEDNLVSTSMLRNSAKANFTLDELGWTLRPPGDLRHWDGLLPWCMSFLEQNAGLRTDRYCGRWYRAAFACRDVWMGDGAAAAP